jgi:heat-inducible transcriptional repressor
MLSASLLGSDVQVTIGSENSFEDLRDCSFVATNYMVGGRVCGTIGVIGPTRMDYRRAVAAVQFMSSNLSELLTLLSIG